MPSPRRSSLLIACFALMAALGLPAISSAQTKGNSAAKVEAKAEIKQAHELIATLRKQRDVTVKRVREMFDRIIRQDKFTKAELEAHRKHLIHERDFLVASAASKAEKVAIAERFDLVIHHLGHAEHLDHKQIEALKTERHMIVKNVEANYNVQIHALEEQVKALAKVK